MVPAAPQRQTTLNQLQACNGMTALALRREQLLQESGRLEFGGGILQKLVYTFCDSPFIAPRNYAATLDGLLECFYHCKTEALERITDDALLAIMKRQFDGPCQGSLELLGGTVLENLARAARCAPPGSQAFLEEAPAGPQANYDDEAASDDTF